MAVAKVGNDAPESKLRETWKIIADRNWPNHRTVAPDSEGIMPV